MTGFDVIYATLDEDFDRSAGVHSMVVWLGRERALRVSAVLHVAAALALGWVAVAMLGGPGAAAAAVARPWGVLAALLYAGTLVALFLEQRWAENVNLAFFKINVWVGAMVLAIVLAVRLAAGGF